VGEEDTQAPRVEQQRRAFREKRLADPSDQSTEEAEHRRRADAARYLDERLEERARSEEDE